MAKLQAPHLTNYRNSEFIQFMIDIRDAVQTCNGQGDGLNLDTPLKDLIHAITSLKAAYRTGRGSELTKDIALIDNHRGQAVRGISMVLQGYANHYDLAISEAATRLLSHMSSYGPQIYNRNYHEETAIINNLVRYWQTDVELKEAVNTLRLTGWVSQLKSFNDEFNSLYLARAGEASDKPDITMEQARLEAAKAYRHLAGHIEAHAILHPGDAYDDLIENLNAFIESYNLTVVRRAG